MRRRLLSLALIGLFLVTLTAGTAVAAPAAVPHRITSASIHGVSLASSHSKLPDCIPTGNAPLKTVLLDQRVISMQAAGPADKLGGAPNTTHIAAFNVTLWASVNVCGQPQLIKAQCTSQPSPPAGIYVKCILIQSGQQRWTPGFTGMGQKAPWL